MSQWGDMLLREVEGFHVGKNTVALWSLGGPSMVVKTPQAIMYIDPFFGSSESPDWIRIIASPMDARKIRLVDAVLSTHEHGDHCEEDTIKAIASNTSSVFIGPSSSTRLMENWGVSKSRIKTLQSFQETIVNSSRIKAYPANDPDSEEALMYLVEAEGVRILHSGDTKLTKTFDDIGSEVPVDIALMTLGKNPVDHKFYMDLFDVIQAAQKLRPKILIPIHWDLWKRTYENPLLLKLVAEDWNLEFQVVILRLGDRFVYKTR